VVGVGRQVAQAVDHAPQFRRGGHAAGGGRLGRARQSVASLFI
jgi:hypothetical protein